MNIWFSFALRQTSSYMNDGNRCAVNRYLINIQPVKRWRRHTKWQQRIFVKPLFIFGELLLSFLTYISRCGMCAYCLVPHIRLAHVWLYLKWTKRTKNVRIVLSFVLFVRIKIRDLESTKWKKINCVAAALVWWCHHTHSNANVIIVTKCL